MRTGMLALALGLLSLRVLPVLPSVGMIVLLALAGLISLLWRSRVLGLFLLGLSWASLSAQQALEDRLAPALDGRTLWLEGRVVGLPRHNGRSVQFELDAPQSRRAELPQRMQLSWFGGPAVNSGERWRLAVTLKRPHGLLNPHGPDREAALLARRIGATGSVKAGTLQAPAQGAWRDAVRQRVLSVDAQGREAELVALVLGDGGGLSRDSWQALQATGTVHLLVISGQHIGLLAGLVYGLIAGLARLGVWPQALPWLPWACAAAFLAALAYGMLAGFQVPVQRACVMLAVVLLWRLRYRHLGVGVPLLFALIAVLVWEPLASLLPGFWLSFSAVAVLLFAFSGRLGGWHPLRAWGRAQGLIAVGLLPVLMALGLPVSLSAPLANLIAVPWLSLAILPLALLGTLLLPVPMLGQGGLWLAGGMLEGLFSLLAYLAQWQPAWTPASLPWLVWLMLCLGVFLLLLPAGLPMRALGWPVLLLAVFAPRERIPHGQVEVWQLDVGQGLAFVLQTRQHTLLYDTGPALGDHDLGERVVLPTLHKLGVKEVDLMLLSHADADHAGGALALKRGLSVRQVRGGEAGKLASALQAQPCVSGERWHWDGVGFSVWQWQGAGDSNQGSCVLLVEAAGERLLLTGDLDARGERAWLKDWQATQVDWLQAPHHGSRTSSSQALLTATAPRGVLLSRGRYNAFGHPHAEVLERYRTNGIEVFDSAEQGALRLRLGAFGEPQGQRSLQRFWRDPS
ncbi:DNA internalization-related competence protein ComEC/Rec2 [Pseudomonas sp. H9]|uniref:DNA internalization-related competence protein ComEC/Rec2 n=1 Tax=Pseudomonas sp. H9 TaxID=483968 RepID=UPI0010578816|nr:DNA internalization-related competence protein ComEC/Rec2 [Pseudomonas sp. H9]TDF85546.1 DNA internalization-related competence protein ComEC/Rec2 [Pseudomonas sp. H9]